MRTNIHVHLFTADHSPPAQLYHLLRGALQSAARELLPGLVGRPITLADLATLDASLDRFDSPWPELFALAEGATQLHLLGGLVTPWMMIDMFTAMSRIDPDDARKILRLGPAMTEAEMLAGLRARTEELATGPAQSLTPFRDALCAVVAELYAAHRKRAAVVGAISQEDVWNHFVKTGPSPMYERVVVLSVNMDEAFVNENLPGLGRRPDVGFPAQMTELEALATKVNAQGGVQIVPFLCVDPRGNTADSLSKLVTDSCGKDKPWKGVKLYPPMGIRPADPRLAGVFDFCQDQGVPVLTHCGAGGAGVRGNPHNYADLAHPDEWRVVLDRLEARWTGTGMLRLCLAHFDGLHEADDISWSNPLIEMMSRYDGRAGVKLYADIAFNVIPENDKSRNQYRKNVERVRSLGLDGRVIFGSDWWMYLYVCGGETKFIEQLNLDADGKSWFGTELDAAADAFLADVL